MHAFAIAILIAFAVHAHSKHLAAHHTDKVVVEWINNLVDIFSDNLATRALKLLPFHHASSQFLTPSRQQARDLRGKAANIQQVATASRTIEMSPGIKAWLTEGSSPCGRVRQGETDHLQVRKYSATTATGSQQYNYNRSTEENYAATSAADGEFVGKFKEHRNRVDYNYHVRYSKARQKLQDDIVLELLHTVVRDATTQMLCESPHENWVVFTAGAMGAGKSHCMKSLSQKGYFPLDSFVYVDPDMIRLELPEMEGYLAHDRTSAGSHTHKEAGFMQELLTSEALKLGKNILVDGSLRCDKWYGALFARIRKDHPNTKIAIIHVEADAGEVIRRAAHRAETTGREVPMDMLLQTLEQVPKSVAKLAPLADYSICINTDGPEPVLCTERESWETFSEKWAQHCSIGEGVPSLPLENLKKHDHARRSFSAKSTTESQGDVNNVVDKLVDRALRLGSMTLGTNLHKPRGNSYTRPSLSAHKCSSFGHRAHLPVPTSSVRGSLLHHNWYSTARKFRWMRQAAAAVEAAPAAVDYKPQMAKVAPLRVVSLNVLAPCYKRLKIKSDESAPSLSAEGDQAHTGATATSSQKDIYFESVDEAHYLERNRKIIDMLEHTDADVIMLQEFWVTNDRLTSLYRERLGGIFEFRQIQRSSHWRKREDGLAFLVRKNKVVIQDTQDIIFHDCGDRVAQMLLLAVLTDDRRLPPQQLIVVNTHLLFPHNEASTSIRKREMTKILGFVESYQRTAVGPVPVVIAGDFNGSPKGAVQSLLREQSYQNAFMEHTGNVDWVSHKSHRQTIIPVDHVMFLNPSKQQQNNTRTRKPDWTNLVYRELYDEILERYPSTMDALREAYKTVDQDKNNVLSKDEFGNLVKTLGFSGENRPALTSEEVEALILSADVNGDGFIDFKEFLDRFWMAGVRRDDRQLDRFSRLNPMRSPQSLAEAREYACSEWLRGDDETQHLLGNTNLGLEARLAQARPCESLLIDNATLYPPELEEGEWPDHWKLTDHGMVVVDFVCKAATP